MFERVVSGIWILVSWARFLERLGIVGAGESEKSRLAGKVAHRRSRGFNQQIEVFLDFF